MPTYPFLQVDAFTDRPLGGNPCAVLLDTEEMDIDTMQSIAKEMNLSETAFLRRSKEADFGARYFTPADEIPLAGHPTIAAISALVDSGRILISEPLMMIRLELLVGIIEIEIISNNGKIQNIVMSQKKPAFLSIHPPEIVMPIFNLSPRDALTGVPIQTVSTGTPQLMIAVRDKEVLRRAQLDFEAYRLYRDGSDFFSPHLFCLEGATSQGRTFARHLGLPPDTLEDPFTGSATGGMAAFLWHHGLIEQPNFIAEQGHWMYRPGQATVEVSGEREDIKKVKVGGKAVVVLRGQFSI